MRTFSLATNGCLVGQKAIIFLAVFSLLLNALMPKFVLEYRNCSEMNQVIENQAVLFTQLNSLTSVAVKIAGAFMKNSVSRSAVPFSPVKKTKANTSSEYSLITTEKRLLSPVVFGTMVSTVVAMWSVGSVSVLTAIERTYLDGDMRGIYVALVLCLFAFARSDVYRAMKKTIAYIPNPTCVSKLGFLFVYDGKITTFGQGN